MGGPRVFHGPLNRELIPEFPIYRRAGGTPYKGIAPPNIAPEIWFVTRDLEDPTAMLIALETTIDLDGLYDLIELGLARSSWSHADALNSQIEADRARRGG